MQHSQTLMGEARTEKASDFGSLLARCFPRGSWIRGIVSDQNVSRNCGRTNIKQTLRNHWDRVVLSPGEMDFWKKPAQWLGWH